MPYEIRQVKQFAHDSRRPLRTLDEALREIDRRRERLGREFMEDTRFSGQAGTVRQQVSEMQKAAKLLSAALDQLDKLTR